MKNGIEKLLNFVDIGNTVGIVYSAVRDYAD
jgi:hypothetical protein